MTRKLTIIAGISALGLALLGAKCSDCDKLRAIATAQCSIDANSKECAEAQGSVLKCDFVVEPTPPPDNPPAACLPDVPECQSGLACAPEGKPCKHNPTSDPAKCQLLETCPKPPPEPNNPPPIEEAPVTAADCPPIDPAAHLRIPARPYGKKGAYTELIVLDSPTTCLALNPADPDPNNCHFEGWKTQQRCERYLIKKFGDGKGECPIWWARTPANGVFRCREDDPNGNSMSCDHFGSADKRDNPKTTEFEGKPEVCGLQRDDKGKPEAGFFTIVLGNGDYGASLPGASAPDTWTPYIEPD